jgi:hypothetical protein
MPRLFVSLVPVLLLAAGTASARPQPLSWGKAGISYADYRADATACLRVAAGTDLTGTEPANALIEGTRRINTALARDLTPMVGGGFDPLITAANAVAQARYQARPDLRFRQAREILQARLDHCLEGRGYQRFHLSQEQSRRANHWSQRDPARQAYLYSLASDPAVLRAQSVGTGPIPFDAAR